MEKQRRLRPQHQVRPRSASALLCLSCACVAQGAHDACLLSLSTDGTPHVGVSRYFKDTVTAVSTRASGLAAQAVGRAVITSITAPAPAPRPWWSIRRAPVPSAAPGGADHGGSRWSRTAEALRGSFPKTVERSILAYAALVCTLGVTDLFCIPAFPLFWTCAGILPLVSVGVIMLLFGCAYIMALLPSAENMYPAAGLTAGMTAFYTLRLLAVDGLRVRGLYSLGDLLLALISWLQLGVLLRNTRQRRRLAALPR